MGGGISPAIKPFFKPISNRAESFIVKYLKLI